MAQKYEDFSEWSYQELEKKFDAMENSPDSAMVYINAGIEKSKAEKNYENLSRAYRTAAGYSTGQNKLLYSDSLVWAATETGIAEKIGLAWLTKGINHYNLREYKTALTAYEKAESLLRKSDDEYLKYKTLYNMALVNVYLGYSEKGEALYQDCLMEFQKGMTNATHPTIEFNFRRYYLYTLHRLINLNQQNGNYTKSADLLKIAMTESISKDHWYERLLLTKSMGAQEFYEKNYRKSIETIESGIPYFIRENQFDWLAVSYYYMGLDYLSLNEQEKGIEYFLKVDSIFSANKYFNPEIRGTYNFLMDYYRGKNDNKGQLFAINRWIEANRYREEEFAGLNLALQNKTESETKNLLYEKLELEKKQSSKDIWLMILGGLGLVSLFASGFYYFKNRKVKQRLNELINNSVEESIIQKTQKQKPILNSGMTDEKAEKLIEKLELFEQNKEYTQVGLTLKILSEQLNTNQHYLSEIINQYFERNFNSYINNLRINLLIKNLKQNPKERKLKSETLAEKYGFSNRQGISNAFKSVTGISFSSFVNELENRENLK